MLTLLLLPVLVFMISIALEVGIVLGTATVFVLGLRSTI